MFRHKLFHFKSYWNLVRILFYVLLIGCNGSSSQKELTNLQRNKPEREDQKVEVDVVQKKTFENQIITNGKLYPFRKNSLRFRSSGRSSKIYVKNGDLVKKGQILARLEIFNLKTNLLDAKNQLQRTEIDLKDALIGHGVDPNDYRSIPDTVLSNVKLRSGYLKAQSNVEKAQYDLNGSVLRAPFSGIIANLYSYQGDNIDKSKDFCDVIDNRKFEIRFPIMETELSVIRPKQKLKIVPYANPEQHLEGIVISINPSINENGSAQGFAMIENLNNDLYEGMNVKLYVNIEVPNKIVIPKKAVVERSNRKVVFTYEKGLAKWNYVTLGLENAESVIVIEGISDEDKIIIKGNTHLANDVPVKIINQ